MDRLTRIKGVFDKITLEEIESSSIENFLQNFPADLQDISSEEFEAVMNSDPDVAEKVMFFFSKFSEQLSNMLLSAQANMDDAVETLDRINSLDVTTTGYSKKISTEEESRQRAIELVNSAITRLYEAEKSDLSQGLLDTILGIRSILRFPQIDRNKVVELMNLNVLINQKILEAKHELTKHLLSGFINEEQFSSKLVDWQELHNSCLSKVTDAILNYALEVGVRLRLQEIGQSR